MALERAKFEGIDEDERLRDKSDRFYGNMEEWCMFKLAYYCCFKCGKAYFGGLEDCIAAMA